MTTNQRPLSQLSASAKRLTSSKSLPKQQQKLNAGWQRQAWDMYDEVGEQRFLANTLAQQLSKAKLFIGKITSTLEEDPEPVEDELILSTLSDIGDTRGGQSQLLHRLAVNLFVAGEGWLVGVPRDRVFGDPAMGGYEWRMLSVDEVSLNNNDVMELQFGTGDPIKVDPSDEDVYIIRIWRPHPRKWNEADSPTRSSLPVLRELVGLTMHISAQVDSRLAGAGVLVVPQSAQRALQASNTDQNVDMAEEDVFTDALIDAMMIPISDRSSPAAVVPLVITAPDEAVDKFNLIKFSSPLDEEARNLREESIRRLALGQDAPPELLLGTGSMNHWGGWLVQEETVTTHIEPPLALICDALTTQYLWPMLDMMGVEDPDSYVIWYSVDHLIARPNRATEALTLHERKTISDEAVRQVLGFDETDAPDVEQAAAGIVLNMVQRRPDLMHSPGLDVVMEQVRALLNAAPITATEQAIIKEDPPVDSGDGDGGSDEVDLPAEKIPEHNPNTSPGDLP